MQVQQQYDSHDLDFYDFDRVVLIENRRYTGGCACELSLHFYLRPTINIYFYDHFIAKVLGSALLSNISAFPHQKVFFK